MNWKEKFSNRLIEKYLVNKLDQPTFYGVQNEFNDKEKTKIISITQKVIRISLSIGTFISMMLIMTYFKNKLGFETMVTIGIVMMLGAIFNMGGE